ncbi:MAG: bifunctional (p)ppGpp synthetase/guanosine-3',5'-bis(diphosphate) 3'-pyrophosphohydrolase [Candidatus Aureabacteria bacterium]|nr:bifunctional (p)ppGpp synthetase/guanosine-3',5'-bis(diphosphate) 3'-pyrophosphohydrolase [Candidatus Auribacterota bacterium]
MNRICEAVLFAAEAHKGQTRKDGKTPYIFHPLRVAARVAKQAKSTEEMIISAYLHDVIEDCGVTRGQIEACFGPVCADYVYLLTNISKSLGIQPRKARKEFDAKRLASAPREVKIIKLCDRIDNLSEVSHLDHGFQLLYIDESLFLYEHIRDGDEDLAKELLEQIQTIRRELKIGNE